jgi:hypothetical protein
LHVGDAILQGFYATGVFAILLQISQPVLLVEYTVGLISELVGCVPQFILLISKLIELVAKVATGSRRWCGVLG